MGDYFNLKYNRTTVRAEILAGCSMFISVMYILAVNPAALSSCGMNYYSAFMATVITSSLATLAMSLYAKMPIVLAPGLSMSALFVWMTMNYFDGDYRITLLATYLSGILFVVLMMTGLFRKIDRRIPVCVKYGVITGIGISLIRTSLSGMGFFEHPFRWESVIVLFGLIVIGFLHRKERHGAIFHGTIVTALVGYLLIALTSQGTLVEALRNIFHANDIFDTFHWSGEIFFGDCFHFPSVLVFRESPELIQKLVIAVLGFTFFHFTDAVGTTSSLFVALREKGAMLPEEYKRKAMYVNGVAQIASGLLGTSSATSYAESVVGIAEGAKTGLAGLTVSILFLLSGFLIPRFAMLSDYVTAPAIIAAGVMSLSVLKSFRTWKREEQVIVAGMGLYIGLSFEVALGFAAGMIANLIIQFVRERGFGTK